MALRLPVKNLEVADLLDRIATLLEASGENRFKVIAYRRASTTIRNMREDVEEVWKKGGLAELPYVGEAITEKVSTYLRTGALAYLENLEKSVPEGAVELMKIPGVGPRTAFKLSKEEGIKSIEQLKRELSSGKLASVLGPVMSTKILESIEKFQVAKQRILLAEALALADNLVDYFASSRKIKVEPAGSLRRGKSTIGDIDVLSSDGRATKLLVGYPGVDRVLESGPTRSSVVLRNGTQVDLRIIEKEGYGAALMYFTGSRDHNIALRNIAIDKSWKLNEYGLFEKGGSRIAGRSEEEIYAKLGLQYIPPELRENSGEIEVAQRGEIPRLIELDDLKGDLQMHSTWSDGREQLEAMAKTAKRRGYQYIAFTDHSASARIANGLSEERFREQWVEIDRLNEKLAPFRILKGVEAEVKGDGTLDFDRKFFDEFDIVGASIHQGYNQSPEKLTERAVKALSHPSVNFLCHPTNRLIGRREGHALDVPRVIRAAKDNGKMLEIDGQPNRLDLDDVSAKRAMEEGVSLVIDSDAHSAGELENIKFGVVVGRRAWLERKHVANTRSLKELLRLLG